jgi:hypothetical protein
MKRIVRCGNWGYEVNYRGRAITLWKEQNAEGRPVWCGRVEVKAHSCRVTRRVLLNQLLDAIDKADWGPGDDAPAKPTRRKGRTAQPG